MTLLPLKQGCALLGIDPKTLRHWMQQAHCSVHPHPSDARIKCVTSEQIEQLAALHGRPLDQSTPLAGLHSAEAAPPLPPQKPASQAEPDLLARLAHLEAQVSLLCSNTWLDWPWSSSRSGQSTMSTGCTRWKPSSSPPLSSQRSVSAPPAAREPRNQPDKPLTTRRAHPTKGRPRPILPLIEYTADGTYIVICPTSGRAGPRPGFTGVVYLVGDHLLPPVPGAAGALERLPGQRADLLLLVCLSPHQRSPVRAGAGQSTPAHARPFRRDGCHAASLRHGFLAAE